MSARTAAGLTGLVLRDAAHDTVELGRLSSLAEPLQRRGTRILTQTSGLAMFPPDRSVPGNVFFTEGVGGLFDLIAVGTNIRTFHGSWARGWYRHLNDLLADGGQLVVPVAMDERAARDGSWSRDDLAALFGSSPTPVGETHCAFARRPTPPPGRSLVSWFVRDAAGIVHSQLMARTLRLAIDVQRLDDMFLEFSLDGAERVVTRPRQLLEERGFAGGTAWLTASSADSEPVDYLSQWSGVLRSVSYLMSGLSYKSAVLRTLLRTRVSSPAPSVLDIGGAYGYALAELLLDDDLNVARAVCCDFDSAYLVGALRMYRSLREELFGRFFFSLARAQEFEFDDDYSLVSLLSSLLYIPQEHRVPVLDRAWESLERGGVLVVYEVLKAHAGGKDHEIQFTSQELDQLLGRYGSVERIGATGIRSLTPEEAGESSIFRIVAKAL